MKVDYVRVQNYRGIRDLRVEIPDMLILVGPNNVGKSALMRALNSFLSGLNQLPDSDYVERWGNPDIVIEAGFSGLAPATAKQYEQRLLPGGSLVVRKRFPRGEKGLLQSLAVLPRDERIRDPKSYWEAIRDDPVWRDRLAPYVVGDVGKAKKNDITSAVDKWLDEHLDSLPEGEKDIDWVDRPGGLDQILTGHMPRPIFVEGIRDPADDSKLSGKAPAADILSWIVEEGTRTREDFQKVEEALRSIYDRFLPVGKRPEGLERIKVLDELEEELSRQMIKELSARFIIEPQVPEIKELLQIRAQLYLDDGTPTPISHKGHGMQRVAVFSLLRTWTRLRERLDSAKRAEKLEGKDASTSKVAPERSPLFLIEEPELFLHPHAQRDMAETLSSLAESGYQVVISTHSPHFVDLSATHRICLLHSRDSQGRVQVKQVLEPIFEEESKEEFKLLHNVDPHRAEMFFARTVVFVEGQSDRITLQMGADLCGLPMTGVSIVEAGSKSELLFYIELAKKFGLNFYVVHDKDYDEKAMPICPVESDYECPKCYKRDRAKYEETMRQPEENSRILRAVGNPDRVIMWEPDLETEFGISAGERNKGLKAYRHWRSLKPGQVPDRLRRVAERIAIGDSPSAVESEAAAAGVHTDPRGPDTTEGESREAARHVTLQKLPGIE